MDPLVEGGTAASDSDSGMGSPMEEPMTDTNLVIDDQQGKRRLK